jgi:hypothetical protein
MAHKPQKTCAPIRSKERSKKEASAVWATEAEKMELGAALQ